MLAAIAHPAVRILAHPRGRITGSRAGVIADWDAVFASAARRGVAIEIDGDPARQDLDHTLASRALRGGVSLRARQRCAHHRAALVCETALAHARLAGIPADRIVNCWPLDRLLAWLSDPVISDASMTGIQRTLRLGRPLWLAGYTVPSGRILQLSGRHDTNVAIVGGGMTGALVAHAFASAGISTTVLEAESSDEAARRRVPRCCCRSRIWS